MRLPVKVQVESNKVVIYPGVGRTLGDTATFKCSDGTNIEVTARVVLSDDWRKLIKEENE